MRVSGLVSSLDWEQLVDQLMQLDARPVNLMMQQKSAIERQQGIWIQVGTLLNSVRNAAVSLSDANLFSEFTVSSSHGDRVIASASGPVVPGVYEIVVEQLAESHAVASESFETISGLIDGFAGAASLIIGGGGDSPTVSVEVAADDTPLTLAAKINDAMDRKLAELKSAGDPAAKDFVPVSAQVIAGRLVLTRAAGGETEIVLDDGGSGLLQYLGFNLLRHGKRAKLKINGIPVESDNNIITAVPGLSIELLEADADTTVKLNVSQDRKAIEGKINAFVTAYNNLVKQLGEWTGKGQPLQGDALARSLMDNIRRRISLEYGEGDQALTLMDMGISTSGTANTISFNAETFWKAYNDNRQAVEAALKAAATELEKFLDPYVRSGGVLKKRDESLSAQVRSLNSSIERMQQRLNLRREALLARFVQLEQLMAQMLTQSNWLAMQTQNLNLNWRGAGGGNRR